MSIQHTRRAGLRLLALASLLILTACIAGQTESRDDTFQVGAAPVLVVHNANGEVRVASGPPGSIRVVAEIVFPDNVNYSTRQSGDTVTVEAEIVNSLLSNPKTDLAITVPPRTLVTIANGNGLITVEGLRASGKVTNGNGQVGLSDVEGSFQATTGNGLIKVSSGTGSFQLSSGNGDIGFKGTLTPGSASRFNSGNGSIKVEFDGPPSVAIDAETGRGKVSSDLEMSVTTLSEPKHLIGMIGDGAADLRIGTGNGDIAVR